MAIIWTHYITAPIAILDIPVGNTDYTIFTDFVKYDADGVTPIGRYTLREYCEQVNTNRVPVYTADNQYFIFGWNFSDLNNNIPNIKALLAAYGYTLGGIDFTNPDTLAYWILNADEYFEWEKLTPHNIGVFGL